MVSKRCIADYLSRIVSHRSQSYRVVSYVSYRTVSGRGGQGHVTPYQFIVPYRNAAGYTTQIVPLTPPRSRGRRHAAVEQERHAGRVHLRPHALLVNSFCELPTREGKGGSRGKV